jgi:tetratricopeptide (TPR) repeat protein
VRAPLEAYLQRYPDTELQNILTILRDKQQHEIVNADEKHGYEALNRGDFATAQAQFDQAMQGSPKNANAIAGLGFVRLKQKRFDEALELFERARALAPQRKDVQQGYEDAKFLGVMDRASVELGRNQPDAAVAAYQQALTMRPSEPQALLGLGQALMHAEKFREAEATFQQVLNQSPNNLDAIAGLGLARLKQGDFAQAVSWLEQVRRLEPNRTDIREAYETAKYWGTMKQAATALDQKHPDAAVAAYQQALALRPGTKDALLGLARAEEDKRDYAGAAQSYTLLTASDPGDLQGWLGLIRAQLKANDAKAALNATQRIPSQTREKIESRSDYLSEIALAYYETNQPSEGDASLQRASKAAARSDSEDALNVRLQIARMLMDQGKIDGGLAVYKQATQLHPDNAIAWEGLVGAYARVRDFTKADAALDAMPQTSYAAAGKNTGFLDAVASIYSQQGRCEEAEDFLNRAANLDKAAGRQPSVNAEMQLADIWMREHSYHKAADKYQ